MGETVATEKSEKRALEAIARELCSVHFTDGFCEPRARPDCKCNKLAKGCLTAMETVGVIPVWLYENYLGKGYYEPGMTNAPGTPSPSQPQPE